MDLPLNVKYTRPLISVKIWLILLIKVSDT